ncbi:MAG: hypothetical protein Q9183_004854 [Haloplaca sp. 2 TL-2023]
MAQKQWQILQPLLPTYAHLIASALIPIYAGAHASLVRPSSAAKPSKDKKKTGQDDASTEDSDDEPESKIEGLTAWDALWFPLAAGCALSSLYFLIKWLEDPAIISKILNWYLAVFGIVGMAQMIRDSTGVVISFALPPKYLYEGQIWKFDDEKRVAVSQQDPSRTRDSPLPGRLSNLPLPPFLAHYVWAMRSSKSTICIRMNIQRSPKSHVHINPTTIISVPAAIATTLYYNLVARPWYLTNIQGFAFVYNALQMISPSTSWTGTLVLAALFLYDIYFVFFTPLMVTVATKLDIPAKLLFPRPAGPGADPAKPSLSMLGLGDLVLPGMMIGFALRLDLYLFYLGKQTKKSVLEHEDASTLTEEDIKKNPGSFAPDPESSKRILILPSFASATSHWGTRFWTSSLDPSVQGAIFPKPYFVASMWAYVIGLMLTLGVMQITNHAQPALFYLVPCVLLGFWGTAIYKKQVKLVWNFDESEANEDEKDKDDKKGEKAQKREKSEEDGKKAVKESSVDHPKSKQGSRTNDFFSFDLKMGLTRWKGTKACAQDYRGSKNTARSTGTEDEQLTAKED